MRSKESERKRDRDATGKALRLRNPLILENPQGHEPAKNQDPIPVLASPTHAHLWRLSPGLAAPRSAHPTSEWTDRGSVALQRSGCAQTFSSRPWAAMA